MTTETFSRTAYDSPIAEYILVSSARGLMYLGTREQSDLWLAKWERQGIIVKDDLVRNRQAINQLDEYFTGKRQQFDLPLDMRGTQFQLSVWHALLQVAYGEMRTYKDIAQSLGRPTATRAVGHANGCNPIAIIVPCHRIIGSDGGLTGYAGGLHLKRALLDLERSTLRGMPFQLSLA
jgi:O-6-methylguanine DNA methyltransferase